MKVSEVHTAFRCEKCNKLLGKKVEKPEKVNEITEFYPSQTSLVKIAKNKVRQDLEIKCPRCKKINTFELNIINI